MHIIWRRVRLPAEVDLGGGLVEVERLVEVRVGVRGSYSNFHFWVDLYYPPSRVDKQKQVTMTRLRPTSK